MKSTQIGHWMDRHHLSPFHRFLHATWCRSMHKRMASATSQPQSSSQIAQLQQQIAQLQQQLANTNSQDQATITSLENKIAQLEQQLQQQQMNTPYGLYYIPYGGNVQYRSCTDFEFAGPYNSAPEAYAAIPRSPYPALAWTIIYRRSSGVYDSTGEASDVQITNFILTAGCPSF